MNKLILNLAEPRIFWLINFENSLSNILFLFSIRELASLPTTYLRSDFSL